MTKRAVIGEAREDYMAYTSAWCAGAAMGAEAFRS